MAASTTLCTAECRGWVVCPGVRFCEGSLAYSPRHQDVLAHCKTPLHLRSLLPTARGIRMSWHTLRHLYTFGLQHSYRREEPPGCQCRRLSSWRLEVTRADVLDAQLESPGRLPPVASSPQRRSLGTRPSSVRETWSSQCRCLCLSTVYIEVGPALSRAVLLGAGGVHGGGL